MAQNKTVLTTERKKTRPFRKKQGEKKSSLFEDQKSSVCRRGQ